MTRVTANPETFLDFTGKGVEAHFGMSVQELVGARTREIVPGRMKPRRLELSMHPEELHLQKIMKLFADLDT
jgi:hypothetical protein